MKEIFEKHFVDLFIFNKKLKDFTPFFHKNGFDITHSGFEFYFSWNRYAKCPQNLTFKYEKNVIFYRFNNNFSIEKNIEIFYVEYIAKIKSIINDINEENDGLDKVIQNNKRILKELEGNHKMLIFL
jgi:hypothetical protein